MHSKSHSHSRCCGRISKELAFKMAVMEPLWARRHRGLTRSERGPSDSRSFPNYQSTMVHKCLLDYLWFGLLAQFLPLPAASVFFFFPLLVTMQLSNHITPHESRTWEHRSQRYRKLRLCAHSPVRRFNCRWQITQHVSHYSLTFMFCQFSLHIDTNCTSRTVKLFWFSLSTSTQNILLVSFTWSLIPRAADRASECHPLHRNPTVFK